MTAMPDLPLSARSRCPVVPAAALSVVAGALAGDPIGGLSEVVAGDVYVLSPRARWAELVLTGAPDAAAVAPGSAVGMPGAPVRPLARHRLMSERGAQAEVLVLAVGDDRLAAPLGPLAPGEEYALISSSPVTGGLAPAASVSFARGTRITLGDGMQRPVETLAEGDWVLTRDHGRQPVRWIGRQTVRADGPAAPVVLAPGALGNEGALVLSPDHRLFLYRRDPTLGLGGAELLVRARDLVDGVSVRRESGGHVDVFHLLLDAHEVIYAEGIPTESLLVTAEILAGLGEDLAQDLAGRRAAGATVPHVGLEPSPAEMTRLAPSLVRGPEAGRRHRPDGARPAGPGPSTQARAAPSAPWNGNRPAGSHGPPR